MQREEKQLENLLEAVLNRLNDLKLSIGAMIHKLETEYETINWPTFLDNFALISSHLTGLSKILSKELGPSLRNLTVLPLRLSPETDDTLLQLTEGRVPVFSHDIVPDYLRTKPEPAAEQRMLQHEQKANNLSSEAAMKQVTQYNKVVSHVSEMVSKAREEWEIESSSRSIRIDDDGKEIETTRQTYRTLFNDSSKDVNAQNEANSTLKGRQQCQTPASTFRTVRYVNSAIFIERDLEEEDESEADDDSNLDDFDFSVDVNEQSYQNDLTEDKFIGSVPVLEIKSNESFPSSDNLTYSYRKVCEATKLIQRPNAYGEWLEAKRMAKALENKRKKEQIKKEEDERQQRKNLAEEKFKEWLQRKAKSKPSNIPAQLEKPETPSNVCDSDRTAVESNFKAWLERKKEQEKLLKDKLNDEFKREKLINQRRQEEAAAMYEDWRKLAPQKPKPVPLNKGMFTLKGSISQLYVNPIPWACIDKTESTLSI